MQNRHAIILSKDPILTDILDTMLAELGWTGVPVPEVDTAIEAAGDLGAPLIFAPAREGKVDALLMQTIVDAQLGADRTLVVPMVDRNEREVLSQLIMKGMRYLLLKPFQPQQLQHLLNRYRREHPAEGDQPQAQSMR